jgi:hypothetical protein
LHHSKLQRLNIFYKEYNKGNKINKLDIESINIERDMVIANTNINELKGRDYHGKAKVSLLNTRISKRANLGDSEFRALNILNVTWPKEHNKINLDGIKFEHISAGPKSTDWKKLFKWIDGSRFSKQAYSQLEEFYRRSGQKEIADNIFLGLKRREEIYAKNIDWLWKFILRQLIGHGREMKKTVFYCIIIITLGSMVFWEKDGMVRKNINGGSIIIYNTQKIEYHDHFYHPIWYSIDLFLPIDLGMAKYWEPKPERCLAWNYSKIQMIMGWALITLLVAAAIGIIK